MNEYKKDQLDKYKDYQRQLWASSGLFQFKEKGKEIKKQ